MKIVDLTPDYLKSLAGKASFEEYRSTYAAFFDHYRKFWGGNDNFVPTLTIEEVKTRRDLMLRHLVASNTRLRECGFSTGDMSVVLFVGNRSADGHAFLDTDGAVAWFTIECFDSELEAKIFTMHELIHALHYAAQPEYAFQTVEHQRNIARQLIAEGIATYLTKRLWNETDGAVLWADKLPDAQLQAWMTDCRNAENTLFQFVAANFESSDLSINLFFSANPEDIYSYRAGYYVGLKLIGSIASANNFSDSDLLHIPLHEMKRLVWNELQSLTSK
jgi:hypothetical protein